jgi:hypothetical protein
MQELSMVADILSRITIRAYGLDAEIVDDHTEGEMFLRLGDGRLFRIAVTDVTP